MASQLPALTYRVLSCNKPEEPNCTSTESLDYMIHERWRNNLEGSEELARTLLSQWGMNDKIQLAMGQKQVYIWAPPCLQAIEIALSLSMARATTVRQLFTTDDRDERVFPTLPCQIRIDDRLSSCGPNADAHKSKASQVLTYLKECATNEHFPQGMSTLQLTPVQPGTWIANHFDIPYLEQRCHNAQNAAAAEPNKLSVAKIIADSARPGYMTGNVILADNFPLEDLVNHPSQSDSASDANSGPGRLFKLSVSTAEKERYEASFVGAYRLIWPATPWAQMAQSSYNKPATSPEETLSWKDLTGPDLKGKLKKVGLSAFKSVKKSMKDAQEEQAKRDRWNNASREEMKKILEEEREKLKLEKRARSNIP